MLLQLDRPLTIIMLFNFHFLMISINICDMSSNEIDVIILLKNISNISSMITYLRQILKIWTNV